VNPEYCDLTVDLTENYYCSIEGDAKYVAHNTRKGAISVYVEPWHIDIEDFIDLKKNSGEERRRAHDLFPALWLNDLFSERIKNDDKWTLFNPIDVPDLAIKHGTEFNEAYIEYENDDSISKTTIKAKDLWKKILRSYFESGSPFLCFKDTANKRNPNSHTGIIRSSNLCVVGESKIDIMHDDKELTIDIKDLYKYPTASVKSKNIQSDKIEYKSIQGFAMTSPKAKVLKITDNVTGKFIKCTPDHKVYTKNRGYIEAGNLNSEDVLDIQESNTISKLIIEEMNEKVPVYDITVRDNHNFYCDGILVHNCTEIFQNTQPDSEKIKVTFENNSILYYDKTDRVVVGTHIKPADKLTSLDIIGNNKIAVVEKQKVDGKTAVCNLASVNLSKINTREDIERVLPIAVRMLDNVITLNYYPYAKVRNTNMSSRSIGLGVMGESQMLAENQIMWGSQEHYSKIDEIMEAISFNTISSSADLARERGSYPEFEGSSWSNGILPIDTANDKACALVDRRLTYDWDGLRSKVKHGIRNGYLMSIAPTSSISILVGTTQAIEPVYKRKWFEENLSGQIPVVAPNLSVDTWQYYTPAYDVEQFDIIKAAAIRQKWIDQGQSVNIFMRLDKSNGKYLNDIYMLGWELGLKSTYYLRSQSPESATEDVIDRSMECQGCQ